MAINKYPKCGRKLFEAIPNVTSINDILEFAQKAIFDGKDIIIEEKWIHPGGYCIEHGCIYTSEYIMPEFIYNDINDKIFVKPSIEIKNIKDINSLKKLLPELSKIKNSELMNEIKQNSNIYYLKEISLTKANYLKDKAKLFNLQFNIPNVE